ncbi:MAG: EscU/YscU/HrcU family type III secretion system export apparatus switch protein [Oligoflexus sp.]
MAEDKENLDRTEEASPERREEFRERGEIAVSKEITSVFILAAATLFFAFYLRYFVADLMRYMTIVFQNLGSHDYTIHYFEAVMKEMWFKSLLLVGPFFVVTAVVATAVTFFQTRINWSWKKMEPNFGRMNPLKGVVRMVSAQALMELFKSIAKMLAVSLMTFLILRSEWHVVPGLLSYSVPRILKYWGEITNLLFLSVAGLLLLVGGLDYLFNFVTLERRMKMTKQEVKEEFKKREVDPHVKSKIKQMQREIAMSKAVQAVSKATVVITNPEHYAIAIQYELGMQAPIVLAKGTDFLAQRMKEVAKEKDVPIVENKPLARTLYKMVKEGQQIPESLYRAVSEVIRYVFLLKGKPLTRS